MKIKIEKWQFCKKKPFSKSNVDNEDDDYDGGG